MQSQHIPFREHGSYVHLHRARFFSFLHSTGLPPFANLFFISVQGMANTVKMGKKYQYIQYDETLKGKLCHGMENLLSFILTCVHILNIINRPIAGSGILVLWTRILTLERIRS